MEMLLVIIFIVFLCFIINELSKLGHEITNIHKEAVIEYIGRDGEKSTKAIVRRIKECEYILTNLYIPTAKGGVTEIDLVAFTDRGLLVFETKNISGTIYGDEDSDQWYAAVHNKNNYFYNPLKQNAMHIKYLYKVVGLNIPIYSIVVFSNRCSIEYLPDCFNDVYVCQMSTLRETIDEIFDENPPCVSSIVLNIVCKSIEKYTHPSEEVIRKHREYVRSKRYS